MGALADRRVCLWDAAGRKAAVLEGHEHWVKCVAWARLSTGRLLASASCDGTVRLWDVPPGVGLGRPCGGGALGSRMPERILRA
jgi:WD40 repeat protein